MSTLIGGWLGSTLAIDTTIMNDVLIALFIALLMNQFVSKLFIFVGLVAGILSVVLMGILHHNSALVIAAIIASFFGYRVDNYRDGRKIKEAVE
ncbi:hypothetical protein [Carnobacterium funditum]|uniref:hypothetical protein n=1 Tax=Carnobacterium funditum TaxID=2752 RepID=UPI000B1D4DAD|nr:hypothetical protein [Carnobacterium funditum]